MTTERDHEFGPRRIWVGGPHANEKSTMNGKGP